MKLLAILLLAVQVPLVPTGAAPHTSNVANAEDYLVRHFDSTVGLVYESEDTGEHWLRGEFPNFHWRYDQTYWLYSDNPFAYLALKRNHPMIAETIRQTLDRYGPPPANLFEVVGGEHIKFPLHDAQNFIVDSTDGNVVMIRRHNSTRLAWGEYVDLWMYEALEHALAGNLVRATLLVRRAEAFWHQNGLWDWSFMIFDNLFNNQKLALLLFTARALGIKLKDEAEMEERLWSMQNDDGGIASLSDLIGRRIGSANAETTALTLLIYTPEVLSRFPKVQTLYSPQISPIVLSALVLLTCFGIIMSVKQLRRRTVSNP